MVFLVIVEATEEADGRTDWPLAQQFLKDKPTKWHSLSWVAARTLIASVNHVLAAGTSSLVEDLRNHWVDGKIGDALRVQAETHRFLVAGDPGEQDGSQYVVAPALSRAAAEDGVGFVLMLSDLIYPSGNVNDYIDGFHKPYRSQDREPFCIDKPIYALPGNHDWYDGLYGFAYHFLPRPDGDLAWPDREVAPTFVPLNLRKTVLDRFCRTMWRMPSSPSRQTRSARDKTAHTGQPAPYFVIDTEHVELVCIDTGIDGAVDVKQMQWLEALSRTSPKPKILMTGKPLLVNGKKAKWPVAEDGKDHGQAGKSIYALVNEPGSGYVATVGGDVHNFQLYDVGGSPGAKRLQHLVSGGAGAYTHATHPITFAESDARGSRRATTKPEDSLFPGEAESLSYFAQQLVPSVWLMFRLMVLFGGGVALGAWIAGADWSLAVAGKSFGIGPTATAALLLLLVIRGFLPAYAPLGRFLRRCLLGCEAITIGLLTSVFAHDQTPEHFHQLLCLYVECTAWICVNAWGLRRSRWWSPVAKGSLTPRKNTFFFIGVLVLAGLALIVPAEHGWPFVPRAGAVLIYVLAALGGWFYRVVPNPTTADEAEWWLSDKARRWLSVSVVVASSAQTLVVLSAMYSVLHDEGLNVLYGSGFSGLALTVLLSAVIVVLPLATGLPGLFVRSDTARRRKRWRWWSKRMRVLVFLAAPLLLAVWALAARHWERPCMKAAFGLPALLTVLIAVALAVDTLRRKWGRAYKLIIVSALVLSLFAGGYLDDRFGLVTRWPLVVVASAALALVAIGASVALAHLVFLGAYRLVPDRAAHKAPRYAPPSADIDPLPFWSFISEGEAGEIILAERTKNSPHPAPARVSDRVRSRADIAFPGFDPPFGPIQKFVAEIYSRDEPPFFKHFLEFCTTPTEVRVVIHRIRGDRSVEKEQVTTISLVPEPARVET